MTDINTILKEGLSVDHLLNHIQESEIVQIATIEATHRFYYDFCFNPYTERPFEGNAFQKISSIHSTLYCALPDWRYKLRNAGNRYLNNDEPTTALYIGCKPKEIIPLKINLSIQA